MTSAPFARLVSSLVFHDVEERLHLLGASPLVLVATGERGNEIAFPELSVPGVCGTGDVRVHYVLGDHGELGENGAVPPAQISVSDSPDRIDKGLDN